MRYIKILVGEVYQDTTRKLHAARPVPHFSGIEANGLERRACSCTSDRTLTVCQRIAPSFRRTGFQCFYFVRWHHLRRTLQPFPALIWGRLTRT